ncbi:hypothetical protein SPB21_11380 [Leptothoe sp. ISB3NOV94-8A]|uniref:hypothetical protein n=1 Tax=Adonisia turfae TaxID=2950184 RepID=UPI0013D31453|nr:hypothetical protein [Adonisia turfae]MDV3347163.1 hypothetical protein [Leptothoe sp. LEGE 181152]
MKIKYRQLVLKLFAWFIAEITLTYVGLDNLADYSEYLKEQSTISIAMAYSQS